MTGLTHTLMVHVTQFLVDRLQTFLPGWSGWITMLCLRFKTSEKRADITGNIYITGIDANPTAVLDENEDINDEKVPLDFISMSFGNVCNSGLLLL